MDRRVVRRRRAGLVVVVYVGNDDHKPLGGKSTGAVAALPVWKNFVDYAVKARSLPTTFSIPADAEVESVSVCKATGFLAAPGCEAAELLLPLGHAPSSLCPWHGGTLAGALADANAPVLLLAPIDEETDVNLYALHLSGAPAVQPQPDTGTGAGTAETPATTVPVTPTQKPKEEEPAKVPSAKPAPAYPKRNYDTPEAVEDRYQENC